LLFCSWSKCRSKAVFREFGTFRVGLTSLGLEHRVWFAWPSEIGGLFITQITYSIWFRTPFQLYLLQKTDLVWFQASFLPSAPKSPFAWSTHTTNALDPKLASRRTQYACVVSKTKSYSSNGSCMWTSTALDSNVSKPSLKNPDWLTTVLVVCSVSKPSTLATGSCLFYVIKASRRFTSVWATSGRLMYRFELNRWCRELAIWMIVDFPYYYHIKFWTPIVTYIVAAQRSSGNLASLRRTFNLCIRFEFYPFARAFTNLLS